MVEDGGVDADAEAAAAAAAAEGEEGDPDGEEAEGAVEGGDLDILDAALRSRPTPAVGGFALPPFVSSRT